MNEKKNTLAEQYYEIKNKHLDSIVMIQVGEFYQAYYNDAVILHHEIGTKVIGKSIGEGRKIPVCGTPIKWGEYRAKELVKLGYKVLLCNQVRDESGKVVAREVSATFKPKEVFIDISEEWAGYLESYTESMLDDLVVKKVKITKEVPQQQMEAKTDIYTSEKIQDMELGYELLMKLRGLDVLNMTPAKMMMLVYEWKENYGRV